MMNEGGLLGRGISLRGDSKRGIWREALFTTLKDVKRDISRYM
jgi:hypothetical protein